MSYPQSTSAPREPGENEYTVGWICAIQEEYEAARKMLDKTFKGPRMSRPRDDNTYKFGQIADHYVVIGCLPFGEYGTNSAATVATNMVRSFPQVRFALMVGIGGGAPTARNDIRLGDVVVASRRGTNGGVVQLDSLRQHQTPEGSLELERFGHLNSPPRVVLGALPEVISRYEDSDEVDMIAENMKRMANRQDFFNRPSDDRLYRDDYIHQGGDTCDACDPDALVLRDKRDLAHRAVVVHYGTIGSSNSRIESAYERNRFANDPNLNILCFEMEAAGLMNTLPCLVIRGISDYADSHKKYSWHKYAALAAAAYARELLHVLQSDRVMEQPSWENVLNEVRELKYELNKDRKDRETEEILSWIAEDSEKKWHEVAHSDYYSKRHPGTGRWFEQHSEFQAWVHGRTHALFCHGPPGAGKSVIASIAINHLRTMQTAENSKCAYLYCNYGRENNGKQTVKHLFSILLRQLCEILGMSNLLREKQRRNTCLTLQDILMAISDIVESYGDVFIIVDALDECSLGDRDDLLQEIAKLQARNTVRFMATSRGDLSSIASQFESLSGKPCSTLEINAAEGDVHSFIEGSLDGIKALTKNPQLRHSIPMRITQAAGPLFLLARFHMKRLRAVDTVQDIEDFLGQLSTGQAGLGKEYDRSLDAIDRLEGPMRRRTYGLLSWVFHSGGSLDSRALRHALSIREGDTRLNTKNLPEIRDIVGRCEGFVAFDGEMETVKFAHATIQEHFQSNKTRFEKRGIMTAGQVALACVAYLSFDEFQTGSCTRSVDLQRRFLDMPFYRYAAQNWGRHAHTASPEIETTNIILDFVENEDKVSAAAQALLEDSHFMDPVPGKVNGTALHLASYFGLGKLVEYLLQRDHNPATRDVYGETPLSRAVQGGCKAVVSTLLQEIACIAMLYRKLVMTTNAVNPPDIIDERNELSQTLLHLAVEQNNQEMVEFLLDNGAATEVIDYRGDTPLHLAVRRNNQEIVELLLDNGATFEMMGFGDDTPLHTAVCNGQENMVRLFLKRGAVIDDSSEVIILRQVMLWGTPQEELEFHEPDQVILEYYRGYAILSSTIHYFVEVSKPHLLCIKFSFQYFGASLLYQAVKTGHKEIAGILAEGGADVNATCFKGMTPLFVAIRHGKKDMVELLLRYGADVNAKDDGGETPLHKASFHGYKDLTKLLIRANADTRARDRWGNTPLVGIIDGLNKQTEERWGSTESTKEYGEVTRLLLEGGTDPNEKYGRDSTILREAIKGGYWAVVEPLLDAGASLEIALDETVFVAGALHDEVAERLLKLIPRTSAQARQFATFKIYVAAIKGQYEEVEQLFSGDADIDKDDILIVSALHHSAERGDDATVKALLNAGVNVDSESVVPNRHPPFQTALHLAALGGHEAVVRRLVKSKASIDKIDRSGALGYAAERGHDVIVEFLLENGADVDAQRDEDTALIQIPTHGRRRLMWLPQKGANINSGGDQPRTPLYFTVYEGHETMVSVLLEKGAYVNTRTLNNDKLLYAAVTGGNVNIVRLLLEEGFTNPSIRRLDREFSLLHHSADKGHHAMIGLLLKNGANVAAEDEDGRTPLHIAARVGTAVVEALMHVNELDVNAKDNRGWTPLHCAVFQGLEKVVELLLTYKVRDEALHRSEINVNAKGEYGETPLHMAAGQGSKEVSELLLAHGASCDVRDDYGWTPRYRAMARRYWNLASLLVDSPPEPSTSLLSRINDSRTRKGLIAKRRKPSQESDDELQRAEKVKEKK